MKNLTRALPTNESGALPQLQALKARRRRVSSWWAAGGTVLALAVAGCTSSGSTGSPGYGPVSESSIAGTASTAASAAAVDVATSSAGQVLVDGRGRTLYLFEADTTSQSTCSDACASTWPPYLTRTKPQARSGVDNGLLGTSARSDGTTQVTYHGHPLYYFVGDHGAGDTSGQGLESFGAKWYELTPSGLPVDQD